MSTNLIQVLITLTKAASPIATPTGAAFASTNVVVTDSTGISQPAVKLNGSETPTPWAFTASVAPGTGEVVATDVDVNGETLGSLITQPFTKAGAAPTFAPSTGITVAAVTSTSSVAAVLNAETIKMSSAFAPTK